MAVHPRSQPSSGASTSSDHSSIKITTLTPAVDDGTTDAVPVPAPTPAPAPAPAPHAPNIVEPLEMDSTVIDPEQSEVPYSTELSPDLGERHINMIAFSTVVGIGFFLQAGRVIYLAGPGLAWVAYLLIGTALWSAVASLGEMTALFPVKGAVFEFPRRFVDEGVGYACGWMSWFAWVVIVAAEITTIANLFKFNFDPSYLKDVHYPPGHTVTWKSTEHINPAVFVILWLILILGVNMLRVRWYGEIEYWIGVMKMLFFVGLILFNIINNARTSTYFKYYNEPWGFESKNFTSSDRIVHEGGSGHFEAMGSAMIVTIFSMIGFETVAITAPENRALRERAIAAPENRDSTDKESIKLATRKISLRIILLYTLGAFVVGLNVPYDDSLLQDPSVSLLPNGSHSVFVIAAVRAGVIGFPSFFNGFFIFSATSAGLNALYISSRLLHALANIPRVWPDWSGAQSLKDRLARTTDSGVPRAAVLFSWLFGWLGFLAATKNTSQVIGRMATNSSVSILIVYTVICGAFLRFHKCTKNAVLGISPPSIGPQQEPRAYNRDDRVRYPYKSHWQYLRAMYSMVVCLLMAFFNGWQSLSSPLKKRDFVASYISFIIFLLLVAYYHVTFDKTWNPLKWEISASLDLSNPHSVYFPNPKRRRGKLHRHDPERLFTQNNVDAFRNWIVVWFK